MHKTQLIENIFNFLRSENIPYMLLRGFDDIPDLVTLENDIDLLCKKSHQKNLIKCFKHFNFNYYTDSRTSNKYLYHAQPHCHFVSKKYDLHFDIVFSLSYRSLNNGEWVSVHQVLQDSIWNNMIKVDKSWVYQPNPKDMAIHLLCHCIFDKKQFLDKHIKSLDNILPDLDGDELSTLLELVFFRFSPHLITHIYNGTYHDIIESYNSFSDY